MRIAAKDQSGKRGAAAVCLIKQVKCGIAKYENRPVDTNPCLVSAELFFAWRIRRIVKRMAMQALSPVAWAGSRERGVWLVRNTMYRCRYVILNQINSI